MASEHTRDDEKSGLSFGVHELRQSQESPRAQTPQRPQRQQPAVEPLKPNRDARGNDPYNTSGSFDRSRNWVRVGKR